MFNMVWVRNCLCLLVVIIPVVLAGEFEDVRCKCLCPVTSIIDTNSSNPPNRKLYIDNVPPSQCNCDFVVLPKIAELSNKSAEFCPRCECKYESRNTTTIRFFVMFIIALLSFISAYSFFLIILEPWINKKSLRNYQQYFNEEVSMQEQVPSGSSTAVPAATTEVSIEDEQMSSSAGVNNKSVLNKVGNSQSRWKRQLIVQRKNIYDDHTMLN